MRTIRKVIGALLLITAMIVTQIPVVETSAAPSSDFQIDKGKLVKYIGTASSVTIPDSVKVIGTEAFAGNTSLTAISIGKNVTEIEYGAFKDCTYLSKISFSDKLEKIGNAVFSGNSALNSITLPKNLKTLGSGVFAGCNNLYEIKIPKDNKNFVFEKYGLYNADKTLLYCYVEGSNANKYTMPTQITDIDEYAFWGNDKLEKITLSTNLREIPSYAFSNCRSLEEISIPYSVKSISSKAFENCISLQKTEIPASVSYIHATAFDGCPRLLIDAAKGTTAYTFYENWKIVNQTSVTSGTVSGNTVVDASGNVYIVGSDGKLTKVEKDNNGNKNTYGDAMHDPSNVDYIPEFDPIAEAEDGVLAKTMIVGQSAVLMMDPQIQVISGIENREVYQEEEEEAKSETNVVDDSKGSALPKYAIVNKNIADYAYYGDTTLTSYTVPSNITRIGEFAFARTGLESIHIPNGVTQIGYAAFYHCDNLNEISIPKSVTWIEPSAFAYTGWLNSWSANTNADDFLIVGDGILLAYKGNSKYVEIPKGVETIAPACFLNHEEIEGVAIPDTVTIIGEEAFMGCTSLQNVKGADNVKKIQDRAFKNTNLKEITLSEHIEKIGIGAFSCNNQEHTVIFKGNTLPQISFTPSTSRLSSNLVEPVFNRNWTAIVNSKDIKTEGTVLTETEFGFDGDIAVKDSSGTISVFDTLSVKKVAENQISVESEVKEWQSDKITAVIPYNGMYKLTLSELSAEKVEDAFKRVYGNTVPPMKVFDMTLEDATGTIEYTKFGTKPLEVTVPLPTEIKGNTVHVAALDQDGQLELLSSSIQDKNGKKYIQFKTTHLSTFAIYALGKDGTVQIENGEVNLTAVSGKKDYSPNTGDMSIHPKWFIALGLSAVAIALMTAKPKRKKSKVQ